MIGFGALAAFAAVVALWLTRRGTVPASRGLMRLAVFGILAPFGANAAGWVFTEMGRQPFVVAPTPTGVDGVFMFTQAAVSPGVSVGELLFSVITLTLVYGALLVVEVRLLFRYARAGVAGVMPELAHSDDDDSDGTSGTPGAGSSGDVLAFAY
jgi:cytochrome d ubiquinol oxidase subunit I